MGFDRLSEIELNGNLSSLSHLKFFKGSKINLPFHLGRSIRGVRFDSVGEDPIIACLSKQDLTNFDAYLFADEFRYYCSKEKNYKVHHFLPFLRDKNLLSAPMWSMAFPWKKLSFRICEANI